MVSHMWMAYSLFQLTLHSEVTNDAAVFVFHTQMLSGIPLTVHSRGHIYNTKMIGNSRESCRLSRRNRTRRGVRNTKQLLAKQEQL